MPPFIVFSLPRSRSAWLSRFLTYGDWVCGHDEVCNNRSLQDIQTWLSQPNVGTVETSAAHWWRLVERYAPDARIVTLRRPIEDIMLSFARCPVNLDWHIMEAELVRLERKLDQIEARMQNVLSVSFDDLSTRAGCEAVLFHCTGERPARDHWANLAHQNIQIDLRAQMRHYVAFEQSFARLRDSASQRIRSILSARPIAGFDGVVFQVESFESWERDGEQLFRDHCVSVGEAPDEWERKNIALMRSIHQAGAMQIMTARSNGRMLGYLMTIIAPSLTRCDLIVGTRGLFYTRDDAPGIGAALQRESARVLRGDGVGELFFESSLRGVGPQLGSLYRRLGAVDHGRAYRWELEAA